MLRHYFSLGIHTCGPGLLLSVAHEPLRSCGDGCRLCSVGAEVFGSSCFGKKKIKKVGGWRICPFCVAHSLL